MHLFHLIAECEVPRQQLRQCKGFVWYNDWQL